MADEYDPQLSIATKKFGRLYKLPTSDIGDPSKLSDEQIKAYLLDGTLMPSITNVISVKNSPYLMPWATKLVATEAVRVAQKWPERLTSEPYKAIDYLKATAERERDFWGAQGSKIHYAVEQIALGNDVDLSEYTDYEKACVAEWKFWVKEYKPKFIALEKTAFGETIHGQAYAGTSDFIAEINGKTVIGDYKCVTDDTPVTLRNGSTIPAKELIEGDEVVAWTEDQGLHYAPVSYVGDNGVKPIIKITTELGQELECTENHPVLASQDRGFKTWVKAENIKEGDVVYASVGWSLSPRSTYDAWPLPHGLAPYVYGVLWSIYNMRGGLEYDSIIRLPKITSEDSREEVRDLGFRKTKNGHFTAQHGLDKIARKAGWTPQQVLDTLSEEIPTFVTSASLSVKEAFMCGVREIFHKPFDDLTQDEPDEHSYVVFKSVKALTQLINLYLSVGLVASHHKDKRSGLLYAKLPKPTSEKILAYGPHPVRVINVEKLAPKSTTAIEVEGSHTHITSGLITHNTNRSGLHSEVSLQLAANKNATLLSMDDLSVTDMIKIDSAVGVHISPRGVVMKEVDVSPAVFNTFSSLREVWDFSMFEGTRENPEGVFLRTIDGLEDV